MQPHRRYGDRRDVASAPGSCAARRSPRGRCRRQARRAPAAASPGGGSVALDRGARPAARRTRTPVAHGIAPGRRTGAGQPWVAPGPRERREDLVRVPEPVRTVPGGDGVGRADRDAATTGAGERGPPPRRRGDAVRAEVTRRRRPPSHRPPRRAPATTIAGSPGPHHQPAAERRVEGPARHPTRKAASGAPAGPRQPGRRRRTAAPRPRRAGGGDRRDERRVVRQPQVAPEPQRPWPSAAVSRRAAGRRRRPPGGPRPGRCSSSASCPPSASRGACACG